MEPVKIVSSRTIVVCGTTHQDRERKKEGPESSPSTGDCDPESVVLDSGDVWKGFRRSHNIPHGESDWGDYDQVGVTPDILHCKANWDKTDSKRDGRKLRRRPPFCGENFDGHE